MKVYFKKEDQTQIADHSNRKLVEIRKKMGSSGLNQLRRMIGVLIMGFGNLSLQVKIKGGLLNHKNKG